MHGRPNAETPGNPGGAYSQIRAAGFKTELFKSQGGPVVIGQLQFGETRMFQGLGTGITDTYYDVCDFAGGGECDGHVTSPAPYIWLCATPS